MKILLSVSIFATLLCNTAAYADNVPTPTPKPTYDLASLAPLTPNEIMAPTPAPAPVADEAPAIANVPVPKPRPTANAAPALKRERQAADGDICIGAVKRAGIINQLADAAWGVVRNPCKPRGNDPRDRVLIGRVTN